LSFTIMDQKGVQKNKTPATIERINTIEEIWSRWLFYVL